MMPISSNKAEKALDRLADDYWELLLKRNPTMATDLGDHRYDDQVPDFGIEARNEYFSDVCRMRRRLEGIPIDQLCDEHSITREVLESMLDIDSRAGEFEDDEWTMNPIHTPITWIAEFVGKQPLAPAGAFDKLMARFDKGPWMFACWQSRLEHGIAKGTTAPRIGVERVLAQLERILSTPPEKSAFIPQGGPPKGLTEAEFDRCKDEIAGRVTGVLYPTLSEFSDFLADEYLPASRTTPGLCAMPGGDEFYAYLIENYTGRTDSPERIHEIGREEIRRLHDEMRSLGKTMCDAGDIRALVDTLRQRPDQYLSTRRELMEFNQRLLHRAYAALPRYFHRLPQRSVEIKQVESYRELDSPSGFYCRAPDGGQRPAYYYVNTHHPDRRPIFNIEALAFHEAVPGHHLQIAIAQDLEGLPNIRRHLGQTSYVEGWALYSERLSDEMGLYSNAFSRIGMLNYQAWRAARLVVDTGIHAFGWSREEAVREVLANTAHGETEVSIEVDRYICMPGQALAYMIGRMEFDSLREMAEARLTTAFEIRAFHDCVLETGAVPLTSLRKIVERWLDAQDEPEA